MEELEDKLEQNEVIKSVYVPFSKKVCTFQIYFFESSVNTYTYTYMYICGRDSIMYNELDT